MIVDEEGHSLGNPVSDFNIKVGGESSKAKNVLPKKNFHIHKNESISTED